MRLLFCLLELRLYNDFNGSYLSTKQRRRPAGGSRPPGAWARERENVAPPPFPPLGKFRELRYVTVVDRAQTDAIRLRHDRAKLVKKYRRNKNLWPHGIDHEGNRWYGDGAQWKDEDIEVWATVKWYEDRLMGRDVTPVTQDVTRSVTRVDKRRVLGRERVKRWRARKALGAANPGVKT